MATIVELIAPDQAVCARSDSDDGSPVAVMVRFTLKTDESTYQSLHAQMLSMARPAGMLFHSSHAVGDHVGIVDFWPSDDAWQAFAAGPLAEGMKGAGIAPPDDLEIVQLINADGS
jgi:hypothetical protein